MTVTPKTLADIRQHEVYIEQIAATAVGDEQHGTLFVEYPGAPSAFMVIKVPGSPPTMKRVALTYMETAKP